MLQFFSSVKLTMVLLLLLAVISIGGTVVPVEQQQYEIYYQSPAFRLIIALLALNLVCCTLRTLPTNWYYYRYLFNLMKESQDSDFQTVETSGDELIAKLTAVGYRVRKDAGQMLADRSAIGRWGAPLVHLSLLLIMVGALWGEAGFVGTINTYLKQANHSYFDWDTKQDTELGFVLKADSFNTIYYPILLRFEIIDSESGRNYGQMTLRDDQAFELPEQQFVAQLRGFDPNERILFVDVLQNGRLLGQYQVGHRVEKFGSGRDPGFRLRNIQFQDPYLKQREVRISIFENGQVIREGTVRDNKPLTHRGVSIYLTAHDRDQDGSWSIGFQLSKDPGEGLVWVATILMLVGLTLAFLWRPKVVGVKIEENSVVLAPLHGWGGADGQQCFEGLLKKLQG